MHTDKHVVKMILETTQLLFGTWHVVDPTHSLYEPKYRLSHKNHPCAIWARASVDNYTWLCELGLALCIEYTFRYGRRHKCESYLSELKKNIPPLDPLVGFTPLAQAMPIAYKNQSAIVAYRTYYDIDKVRLHRWKKRTPPKWIGSYRTVEKKV